MYETGWFACVLGGAHGRPWLGSTTAAALVAAHVALADDRRGEIALIAAAIAVGIAVETALTRTGMLVYAGGPWPILPPWIAVLWAQFATLPRFSLAWILGRPARAGALAAVGAPLAFVGGARLGAVHFGEPHRLALAALATAWAAAFPVVVAVATRLGPGRYRPLPPSRARGGRGKNAAVRRT